MQAYSAGQYSTCFPYGRAAITGQESGRTLIDFDGNRVFVPGSR